MATITPTIIAKIPLGRDWLIMMRTPALTGTLTSDLIPKSVTGFRKIRAAFGVAIGATPDTPTFVYNSANMANAEDSSPGDLSVAATSAVAHDLWVIGRGRRGTI